MRVLILGGTQAAGPYIARELDRRGHRVTVFHRGIHEADLPDAVRHVHGDRRVPGALAELAAALRPDAVVDMLALRETDALAVIDAFPAVRRAVFVSSGDVYEVFQAVRRGQPSPQPYPIPEDAPLRRPTVLFPNDPEYDKVPVEEAVRRAHGERGFPGVILRFPAVYGPGAGTREWYWIKRALDRRPFIALPDGGLNIFHRGHAANVARAVALAVEEDAAVGRAYNVGDTRVYTVRQITDMVAEAMDHWWEVVSVPALAWTAGTPYSVSPHIIYDLTRIRRELGYEDAVDPETGLVETVRWLAAHPPEMTTALAHAAFDYEAEDRVIQRYRL